MYLDSDVGKSCRAVLCSGLNIGFRADQRNSRCPGNHLADSLVWLSIVSMLSMLDIRKKRDEKGVEIEPVVKFENSVFRSVLFRFVLLVCVCCDVGFHLSASVSCRDFC